jgi:hypothetical protein
MASTRRPNPSLEAEVTMIADRCGAASPAPWQVWCEGRDGRGGTSIIKTGAGADIEVSPATADDLDLIAAARSAIPKIVEALRGEHATASEEIRILGQLVARATPAPWHLGVYSSPPRTYPSLVISLVEIPITGASLEDLIFMVSSPADVARLLELWSLAVAD